MRAYIAMSASEHFNQPSANRRVKMKSLLLTVLAFGLLSSSSFAQEKSPEQLREESTHIWGVEGLEKQQPSDSRTTTRHPPLANRLLQRRPRRTKSLPTTRPRTST